MTALPAMALSYAVYSEMGLALLNEFLRRATCAEFDALSVENIRTSFAVNPVRVGGDYAFGGQATLFKGCEIKS
jgi:hypothetical protein